jgi:hypothetical protein
MRKFGFITLNDFAEYFANHQNAELGFTDDIPGTYEATGWYGIKISEEFDARTVIIGFYGGGICYHERYHSISKNGIMETMKEFFEQEFDMTIHEDTLICVYAEDFEDLDEEDFK